MMLRLKLRSLAVASLSLVLPLGNAQAECRLPDNGPVRAAAIPDGRTLVLEDGREILLAGLEPAPAWPGAQAALARRVAGQSLMLNGLSAQPDRHGRRHAFVSVSGSETPVQYDLLREGAVRVSGFVESPACREALLAQEKAARAAKVGLWSDPVYEIGQADDPAGTGAGRGHFAIIEGKVLSVRESGGTIYVNFGRRWSEDVTAAIPKRLEGRFAAGGMTPRSLVGRSVRIRGIVEERGGPWIELLRPDQIEFAETGR